MLTDLVWVSSFHNFQHPFYDIQEPTNANAVHTGQGKIGYTTGAQPAPKNSERTGWAKIGRAHV